MSAHKSIGLALALGTGLALGACGATAQPATQPASTASSPIGSPATPAAPATGTSAAGQALGTARPELAAALADPQAAIDAGLTCTYGFLGYASAYLDLNAEQTRAVLEALAQAKVGPESGARWNDYGDDLVFTWPDGSRARLSFEGHEVLVDADDPKQAHTLLYADALWSTLSKLQGLATADW